MEVIHFLDLDVLSDFEVLCFPDEPWDRKAIDLHTKNHKSFIGLIDKVPVAYALFLETPWEVEIFRIGVLPEFRNRGFGRAILSHIIEEFIKKSIFLEVKSSNEAALHLYESLGFAIIDQRRDYYPDGSDALVLQRSPN